ncbi:DUF222 domain-containing protein [Gordonia zhaorongruii]|uniref:DUF222 domain-containing protein n=1 Tax=Gordonia zhaorongruii TaxID=2597659 RepID=UPI00117CE5F3|nr:DUF222 domain-containing protein [Gordonia zhaorongruii]
MDASTVSVTDDAITIRIPRPATTTAERSDRAGLLQFAARADSFQGLVLWHRYHAIHTLLHAKSADLDNNAGRDSYTRLYDALTQTAASYAAVTGYSQYAAETFLDLAIACHERIPAIGTLLRHGILTPAWFREAVTQTTLVDDTTILALIDTHAAHRLATAGTLSRPRVRDIVATIVAEHDADAARHAREATKPRKKVTTEPLDNGLSELAITADTADIRLSADTLDAVITGVCPHDPRTRQVLRSDAAIARLTGTAFTCRCDRDDCTADLTDTATAARCASIVLHVIARRDTLTGESDLPAHLDGHGPITADHARELAARTGTIRRDLDLDTLLDHTAQHADPYRPTATCDTAVRALHAHCTWPGCHRPAWASDLDHITEYNHSDPAAGGATCFCNLAPKCRFHHGLKTHATGWIDDQITDAHGIIWTEITTPEGITTRARATNTWLLPELGLLPCQHPPPTNPGTTNEPEPRRPTTRTTAKHRYRMAARAQNRRRREQVVADDGEPPF